MPIMPQLALFLLAALLPILTAQQPTVLANAKANPSAMLSASFPSSAQHLKAMSKDRRHSFDEQNYCEITTCGYLQGDFFCKIEETGSPPSWIIRETWQKVKGECFDDDFSEEFGCGQGVWMILAICFMALSLLLAIAFSAVLALHLKARKEEAFRPNGAAAAGQTGRY